MLILFTVLCQLLHPILKRFYSRRARDIYYMMLNLLAHAALLTPTHGLDSSNFEGKGFVGCSIDDIYTV
jgi:hypothetical protein